MTYTMFEDASIGPTSRIRSERLIPAQCSGIVLASVGVVGIKDRFLKLTSVRIRRRIIGRG